MYYVYLEPLAQAFLGYLSKILVVVGQSGMGAGNLKKLSLL